MKKIFKYPIKLQPRQIIEASGGAVWLDAQVQKQEQNPSLDPDNQICMWAIVDPESVMNEYVVRIYGTGHEIHEENLFDIHVGTVQMGQYVWHVFVED